MRWASDRPSAPPSQQVPHDLADLLRSGSSIMCRKWLYSPRSASGSSRSTAAWAWRGIVANRIRSGSAPVASAPSTRIPRPVQPIGCLRRCLRPGLAQPHEVGVRVEHDHAQVGVQQELLEDDAERVRLARAALAAQERVPAEALRAQPGSDTDTARRQVPIGSAAFRDCCSDSRSPAEAASTAAAANGRRGTGPSFAVAAGARRRGGHPGSGRPGCGRRLEHLPEQRSALGQGEHDEVADHQSVSAWSKVNVRPSRDVANSGLASALCVTRAARVAAEPGTPAPQ